jgi:hypothetical protein
MRNDKRKHTENRIIISENISNIPLSITGWWFGTFGSFSHILGIVTPTD